VFSGTNFISYYIYDYVTSPKYGILIGGTATSFGGVTPAA